MKILFYSLIAMTFLCSELSAQIDTSKNNELRLSLYSINRIKPFFRDESNYFSNNTSAINLSYLRKLKSDKFWFKTTLGGIRGNPNMYVFNKDQNEIDFVDTRQTYFYSFFGVESQQNFKYFAVFPSVGFYFDSYAFEGNLDYLENPISDFRLNRTNVGTQGAFTFVTNLSETFYLFIRTSLFLTYEKSYRSHEIDGSAVNGNGWGFNYNMRLLDAIGVSKRF